MKMPKDFYKILGVSETTSTDEIKKAYRKLAKKFHPDANKGNKAAESRFKEISEAYGVIGNEKKRREYDAMRKNPFGSFGGSPFQRGAGQGDFSSIFGDLLGDMFSGGRGQRRKSGFETSFSDFGGSQGHYAGQQQNTSIKGQDITLESFIPFDLSVKGGDSTVNVPSGKKIRIKILPGTEDGKKIKLSGQGHLGPTGIPGDLFVVIKVREKKNFERKGNDIIQEVPVSLFNAVLGAEIKVKTIWEQTIKIKVTPGSDSGKLLKIKGMGVKEKNSKNGDLYIKLSIVVPKDLSETQKKKFEKLAKEIGGNSNFGN